MIMKRKRNVESKPTYPGSMETSQMGKGGRVYRGHHKKEIKSYTFLKNGDYATEGFPLGKIPFRYNSN